MDPVLLLVQGLNGVQYGIMLFLMAAGLTLVFGVMNLLNLAQGSFYMLGAYLAATLLSRLKRLRHPEARAPGGAVSCGGPD